MDISTKTCHDCKHVVEDLPLDVREWACPFGLFGPFGLALLLMFFPSVRIRL